jgi:putative membrane protein
MVMWYFHNGMHGWAFLGGILNVLSWAVLIALIVWVIGRLTRHDHSAPRGPEKQDALEIARLRYAKGEITQEEFETIKRTLLSP